MGSWPMLMWLAHVAQDFRPLGGQPSTVLVLGQTHVGLGPAAEEPREKVHRVTQVDRAVGVRIDAVPEKPSLDGARKIPPPESRRSRASLARRSA